MASEAQKQEDKELKERNAGKGPGGQISKELAESEKHQDKDLAEKGIYQPHDQVANKPDTAPEDGPRHEEHRKNLADLPPVPSEKAGAASQAK